MLRALLEHGAQLSVGSVLCTVCCCLKRAQLCLCHRWQTARPFCIMPSLVGQLQMLQLGLGGKCAGQCLLPQNRQRKRTVRHLGVLFVQGLVCGHDCMRVLSLSSKAFFAAIDGMRVLFPKTLFAAMTVLVAFKSAACVSGGGGGGVCVCVRACSMRACACVSVCVTRVRMHVTLVLACWLHCTLM